MFGPDRPPVCMSSLRLDHGNASEPQRWCRPLQVKKKQNNWSRQKWSDARGNIQLTARNRHTAAFKHPQRIKNAFAPLLIWLFFFPDSPLFDGGHQSQRVPWRQQQRSQTISFIFCKHMPSFLSLACCPIYGYVSSARRVNRLLLMTGCVALCVCTGSIMLLLLYDP